MKRCANIPVFIPHAGCPNACIFCDQHVISGQQRPPEPGQAARFCRESLEGLPEGIRKAEIAFFGGSFTAIPRRQMVAYLEAVQPCREHPKMAGIRLSTRPDAIDREVLDILARYGVTAVELGVQSLSDRALSLNRRGHDADATRRASALIREYGMELGHQMMLGMYGDTPETFLQSVESSIALHPDTARIYPVAVLRGTRLEELWREGKYCPPALEEAMELGAEALRRYTKAGVKVIRMGLHASQETEQNAVAGIYHPAFRELCESRVMLKAALEQLSERPAGAYTITVAKGARSKMTGQHRANLAALEKAGYSITVAESEAVGYLKIMIK